MSNILRLQIKKSLKITCGVITLIITFVPENIFKLISLSNSWSDATIVLINRVILFIGVLILTYFSYFVYCKIRKKVSITGDNFSIEIRYGNLFDITDGKVVINFDECFTTKVGEEPAEIKPGSVCGQFLTHYPTIDILKLIDDVGVKPERGKSQYDHKPKYKPGTIVPNERYLLMAFAKLDSEGLGRLTYEEYVDCLNTLWEQIDKYHGTEDVYLPILGSKITRFDRELTQQELLDIMIVSYWLSPKRMKKPCKLHIICKPQEGFSLSNIKRIQQ